MTQSYPIGVLFSRQGPYALLGRDAYDGALTALGEINIAASEEIALTLRSGVTVRVGSTLSPEKLERFDAVWRALGEERTLARAVYLNNRVHQQRVTVRLRRN